MMIVGVWGANEGGKLREASGLTHHIIIRTRADEEDVLAPLERLERREQPRDLLRILQPRRVQVVGRGEPGVSIG